MKRIIVAVVLIFAVFVFAACASGGASASKNITLDQAIQEAARNLEDNIQAGYKIAILNFTSPTEQFSEYVIDELSIQLANGKKLVVVDRRELDLIRQEEKFQLSGEVSDKSAQSIGKKLGAQIVVSGTLNAMGNAYRFRIRALNVESAVVETGSTANLRTGETKIVFMLSGAKPTPVSVQTPAAQQPAQTSPKPAVQSTQPAATVQTAPPSPGFVRVEGGTFKAGNPAKTVTISGFYMGKYEVTQKEYRDVMGSNPSKFKGDNMPVGNVGWYNAVDYCNKRSLKEGLTPAYTGSIYDPTWNRDANGYRLPTEAEWEYAARGGNRSPGNYTYAGSNNVEDVAWYSGNSSSSTQNVGTKKSNKLGFYDMSGNVWEFCWDRWGTFPSGTENPTGSVSGIYRVRRGGSWYDSADKVRSTNRHPQSTSISYDWCGFRVVRNSL